MSIKLNAQSGGSVALDAPTQTTSSADLTFKLPVADGSANQLLKTDGSGNLGWATDQGGKILQVKSVAKVDTFSVSGSANGATDVTGLSVTMDAPASSGSKYLVSCSVAATSNFVGASVLLNGTTTGQLLTGSSAPSGGTNGMSPDLQHGTNSGNADSRQMELHSLQVLDSPGTSAVQTYKVQVYVRYVFQSGYSLYVNRPNTNSVGSAGSQTGGVTFPVSTITVMEIAA